MTKGASSSHYRKGNNAFTNNLEVTKFYNVYLQHDIFAIIDFDVFQRSHYGRLGTTSLLGREFRDRGARGSPVGTISDFD